MYLENRIKNELNINLNKRLVYINISKNDIDELFKVENYIVKYVNYQNNSINGSIEKNHKKYFFKLLKKLDFIHEITGYIEVKNVYPVNKIVDILEFKNYSIIIYEYDNTIGNNIGLLNDFFVTNDIENKESKEIINKIINLYSRTFKKTVNKYKYPMERFFKERVDSRLIKWYKEEKLFDYNISINGIECKKTAEIINETIEFFKSKHKLECSITQGDPNTLNIGIKPVFFDFLTAGYNPIICEFVTMFWSVLFADAYFCLKYHRESYYNHANGLKNIGKFTPNLKYKIDKNEKKINIYSNIKTSKIRTEFVKEYIKMMENLNIKVGKEIIYFFTMRILCVFDIRHMEEKDFFYSVFLLHFLYKNISEDVYASLKTILNNLNIIESGDE